MTVFVNDKKVDVLTGMTVRHALSAAGLLKKLGKKGKVFDEWGNEIGLTGELTEGVKIYLKRPAG